MTIENTCHDPSKTRLEAESSNLKQLTPTKATLGFCSPSGPLDPWIFQRRYMHIGLWMVSFWFPVKIQGINSNDLPRNSGPFAGCGLGPKGRAGANRVKTGRKACQGQVVMVALDLYEGSYSVPFVVTLQPLLTAFSSIQATHSNISPYFPPVLSVAARKRISKDTPR